MASSDEHGYVLLGAQVLVNESDDEVESEPSSDAVTPTVVTSVPSVTYSASPRRWVMLTVLALLNFSNGMIWITYSPIADVSADFYDCSSSKIDWFAEVFMLVSVVLGLPAIWFIDMHGLCQTIHLSAWLNMVGAVIRALSGLSSLPGPWRYPLGMLGQTFAAVAQPLVLLSPTKLASRWFPDHQRALANTIGCMGNPVGIMVANVLSPVLTHSADDMFQMLVIFAAPAVLGTVLALIGVHQALPTNPPSLSTAVEVPLPFITGLREALTSKSLLLLAITFGSGLGLFTAISTLLEQMLCSRGYANSFSGLCGALLFAGGLVGATVAGVVVDRTKKFEETAKVCFCLAALGYIGFTLLLPHQDFHVPLALVVSLMGAAGFALFPVCNELAVECTYPIPEATSAGLLGIVGQICSVFAVMGMQGLAQTLRTNDAVCHGHGVHPMDYTTPHMVISCITVFVVTIFVAFFRCGYQRLRAERQAQQDLH